MGLKPSVAAGFGHGFVALYTCSVKLTGLPKGSIDLGT